MFSWQLVLFLCAREHISPSVELEFRFWADVAAIVLPRLIGSISSERLDGKVLRWRKRLVCQ